MVHDLLTSRLLDLSGATMILEDLEHRYNELKQRIELVRSYL